MTTPAALATSPKTFRARDEWLRAVLASDLPHVAVRLAVRIALHLHVTSGRCNPGYDLLAAELHMSRRSIIRLVSFLERTRWIAVMRPGHHRPNQFCLLRGDKALSPLRGDKALSPQDASEVTNSTIRGDKSSTSGVTHAVTHKAKRTAKRKAEESQTLAPGVASRDLKEESPTKKTKPTAREIDDSFAEFWRAYPKRVAREAARKAFAAAVKGGADPVMIVDGAKRYAAERAGQEPRFTAYPKNWLHDERWNDPPPAGPVIDQAGNEIRQQPRRREETWDDIIREIPRGKPL